MLSIEESKTRQRAASKKWSLLHGERRKELRREYYWAHRTKALSDHAAYYQNNKERLNKYSCAYQKTLTARFNYAKREAQKRELEFNLTFPEYGESTSKPCDYCGGVLPIYGGGLDRKDNSKGYLVDNVVPCCRECNTIKGSTLTYEEAKATIGFLTKFRKENQCSMHL